jgi:mycobactin salicyl-AMP ligase
LGEKVCAAVVVESVAPTVADLKTFLTERGLAAFKHPDTLRVVKTLPTTAVGKVDKRALTAMLRD